MINNQINAFIAVISHKRPGNVRKIIQVIGCEPTFFVNIGEATAYYEAGAHSVVECGTNICEARNKAIAEATKFNLPCVQISDDLKSLKKVRLDHQHDPPYLVQVVEFDYVAKTLIAEMVKQDSVYGGVAVTTNRLNYQGIDYSHDKLVVCDLVCIMPGNFFDGEMALKEDYDMTIQQLVAGKKVVRCNQFLCDFPHRDNDGGANTYRNSESEQEATMKLHAKWGDCIKAHPTRPGQVALNYEKIKLRAAGQQTLL